ncbi:unnamed protein product [Lampetra planeri]
MQVYLGELMHRLGQCFGACDREEAKAALNASRRQPGEDLHGYAEDVHSLMQSARSGYAAEIIDDFAAEKVQQYLIRTAWWQPDANCPYPTLNTLVKHACASTAKNAATAGDWLRELVAGITEAMSLSGGLMPEGRRSLWSGDGDRHRSLGKRSHHPRNWQQGPGESHGLRGATWLERPRVSVELQRVHAC